METKKHTVVMLPTENGSRLLKLNDKNILNLENSVCAERAYYKPQHLYILSSEPINDGDWCIDVVDNVL